VERSSEKLHEMNEGMKERSKEELREFAVTTHMIKRARARRKERMKR